MPDPKLQLTISANNVPGTLPYPATPKDLIETYLPLYLRVNEAGMGNLDMINVGSATPGASESDKPWLQLDGAGRPIGWFVFFNGAWERVWDVPIGTIMPFNGTISNAIPKGWALANGLNSEHDMTGEMTPLGEGSDNYVLGFMIFVGYA